MPLNWRNILNNDTECLFFISFRTRYFFSYSWTYWTIFWVSFDNTSENPVHRSILMMKSNPEYEGQIVNKKIHVWDEEKTLVSPRAFSPWNLFRLKVFDNSEKSATILLFLAVSVNRWTCFHVHIYLKPINNILNEM